jgi:hypothetical protein
MNATADYSRDAVNGRDEDVLLPILLTFDIFYRSAKKTTSKAEFFVCSLIFQDSFNS